MGLWWRFAGGFYVDFLYNLGSGLGGIVFSGFRVSGPGLRILVFCWYGVCVDGDVGLFDGFVGCWWV